MNNSVESLIGILNEIDSFKQDLPVSYFINRHITAFSLQQIDSSVQDHETLM